MFFSLDIEPLASKLYIAYFVSEIVFLFLLVYTVHGRDAPHIHAINSDEYMISIGMCISCAYNMSEVHHKHTHQK